MDIIEVDLGNLKQVKKFLELPSRLYANNPHWVPPLEIDAKRMLNRERNSFFKHGQAGFFIIVEGDKVIGRLSVLDHMIWNEYNHERTAFFYLFECENNLDAARALFDSGIAWAQQRGLNRMIGPKGFTVFDGLGLLVKGFEHRPAFGLPYNPPYYVDLVEALEFTKMHELVSGYLDESMQFPEAIHQIAELLKERRGLVVTHFKSRKDIREMVDYLRDLYNASLVGTHGNVPITEEEAQSLLDQILWFADPHLIKIVKKGDKAIGFLLAYPDISAAVQRTHGELFPFGWLHLLLELRRTKWINMNGVGMVEGYRGVGGTALLFSEMYKSVSESRYRFADLVQVGTENEKMQREMRDFGIEFYKLHRLYERNLK